jgi:hypothetical protein
MKLPDEELKEEKEASDLLSSITKYKIDLTSAYKPELSKNSSNVEGSAK